MQLSFLKGYGLHTAKLLFSGETVFGGDGWWENFSFVELLTKVDTQISLKSCVITF
jgi:hypothetical protein